METSETTGAIAAALAKAHLEIENPELDGINPHFKSRFSTLAAVLNAVRKPLAKQGIALMQSVSIADSRVAVTTSMIHASGEWMRETMAFPIASGANVQQAGSTVTYLRRYSLISLCAIVGDPHEDDDGDADRADRTEQAKQQPRQRTNREAFKPDRAKGAPPAPEAPAQPNGVMDRFPDEFEGEVTVCRVTRRQGRPHAVQIEHPDHGRAWVQTKIEDFAACLEDAVGQKRILGMFRIGPALDITHIKNCVQEAATVEADANALPF